MTHVPKVLIFGHSFIKRLQQRTEADPLNFKPDLDLKQCSVVFKGFGGLTLGIRSHAKKTHFYALVDRLLRYSAYDIIVCQLGGNDISCDTSPKELAHALAEFVEYVKTLYGIKVVYICSVFTRHKPRGLTAEYYEIFRLETNVLLQDSALTSTFTFWPHKRIFNSPHTLFLEDGTHLNDLGTKKFFNSLRRAVIFAVEQYQSE